MSHGNDERRLEGVSVDARYARLAAELLAKQQQECTRPDGHRDAVIAAMGVAMETRKRRRFILGAAAVSVAAAAAVVFLVRGPATNSSVQSAARAIHRSGESAPVVEYETGRGNQLVRAGTSVPLPDLGVLAVGDSVRSGADGSATLAFANGTRLALSPNGQLHIDELGATRRFSLLGGKLQAHVAKLAAGERFIVTTPDSEVEVRGTVFSVAVEGPSPACPGSSSTSTVFVSEGGVWVRSRAKEIVLDPGETWSTPCQELRASVPVWDEEKTSEGEKAERADGARASVGEEGAPRKSAARLLASRTRGARPFKPGRGAVANKVAPVEAPAPASPQSNLMVVSQPTSSLAEQNDLFAGAMAAERKGFHGMALSKLDDLLTRFPDGPLSESARAERDRILSAQSAH